MQYRRPGDNLSPSDHESALPALVLLWLAIPLLLLPWLVRPGRQGHAAGQLVLAGLGLAALWQGEQTLAPAALRQLAAAAPGDAQFIGITVGALLTGTLLPSWRSLRATAAGLPLAIGLVTIVPRVGAGAFAAGLAVGAGPWVIGMLAGAMPSRGTRSADRLATDHGIPVPRTANVNALLAVAAAAAAWLAPLLVAAALLAVLAWRERLPRSARGAWVSWWPVVATLLLAAWGWLAVTIAGNVSIPAAAFERMAPASPAAEVLLAAVMLGWLLALAAPWPFDRLVESAPALPGLAVVGQAVAVHGLGVGVSHWQPLLSAALVSGALAAIVLRRWPGALAAVMLLGATRGDPLGCAGALALATVGFAAHAPRLWRAPAWGRTMTMLAGAGAAAVVTAVLHDEVVLGVMLGLGIPAAAAIAAARVAPPADRAHL